MSSNELFFTKKTMPQFHIIKDLRPFHFSLPGRKIFLSVGLLSKYIKNEGLLASVLTYELIRSEKLLYPPVMVIPFGFLETEQILSLLRLPFEMKMKIHKWSFHSLRRSGIDPDFYLSWLQIQNRNNLDFMMQLGDTNAIAREETVFKLFLVALGKRMKKKDYSSPKFYQFIRTFEAFLYE